MIHTGMGIGVLPEQVVRNYLPALDVAMVPLTDVWARRELKLGVRNLESLSVTARQMLEHLTLREGRPERSRSAARSRHGLRQTRSRAWPISNSARGAAG